MTIYLDCNATTPIDPAVLEAMWPYFSEHYGNAGSRTHESGLHAKRTVDRAREQVASLVNADPSEVVFTSGATESNNIAILGLSQFAKANNKRHIITTSIEHHAVLEPMTVLERQGFEITRISPPQSGRVSAQAVLDAVRDDTILISVMQANNETGVLQPISEIASLLRDRDVFFHIDAAQGFGKDNQPLKDQRIDLISVSGHKIYGPKGIGALITRRRHTKRPPLSPLTYGGGQERGLRPGTLPVALIVGLGSASVLAERYHNERSSICKKIQIEAIESLGRIGGELNGDEKFLLPNTVNISFPGADAEAIMIALRDLVAVSNGSACTSEQYQASHVLTSMQLSDERVASAIRFSWCHLTPNIPWNGVSRRIRELM